jgi:hypothetical protein
MAGQRKALIVANDQYENEGLGLLRAPSADADALRRVLGDPDVADFTVQVVHNEPAHLVQAQIDDLFSDGRPDDLLLLHFSCHGLKSESGELFFAATNTNPTRLVSTATSAEFVRKGMRSSRSRSIVLLLDCCYGGAFTQGAAVRAAGNVNVLDSFSGGKLGGGRGRAVITASTSMEYAFEGGQLTGTAGQRPSVFTAAVVDGLATGDADRDEDGWVSVNELYDYVFDKVQEQNPHQTPSSDFQLQGELYLARSHRPARTERSPSGDTGPPERPEPPSLVALQSQLTGDDLTAAGQACMALTNLAGSEDLAMVETAGHIQRAAAIQPEQTYLNFGQLQQGAPVPHRVVALHGPPIARACITRASHGWLHADRTATGLDISIDTGTAIGAGATGPMRGSITLSGPTGQAVITVDADIRPSPAKPTRRGADSPAPGRALVLGSLLLCVPVIVIAYHYFQPVSSAQWWATLLAAVLGIAVSAPGFRRSRIRALALECNLAWCLAYAIYRPELSFTAPGRGNFTPVLFGIAAVVNLCLCLLALTRQPGRKTRRAHWLLALFLAVMTLGLTTSAIAYRLNYHLVHHVLYLHRTGAVILLAALLVNLAAIGQGRVGGDN